MKEQHYEIGFKKIARLYLKEGHALVSLS